MYAKYFQIEESPFCAAPDPRYLYMSEKHREALGHLLYGVSAAGGFVLLTGEVGTGKTTLCRCLVDQLPENVDLALCFNPRLSEIELLADICGELGIRPPSPPSLKALVDALNRHLLEAHARGRTTVVVIDEAQDLNLPVLEQIRLLTNLETERRKLLQIILIGQPELDEMLASTGLRQLAQRVTARYHLEPLDVGETASLIRHRLQVGRLSPELFSKSALREVHRWSRGIPRLTNSICDRALLAAYALDQDRVQRRLVRQASAEVLGRLARRRQPVPWLLAPLGGIVGVAAAVLVLLTLHMTINGPLASLGDLFSLTRGVAETLPTARSAPTAVTPADDRAGGESGYQTDPSPRAAETTVEPGTPEPPPPGSQHAAAAEPLATASVDPRGDLAAIGEPDPSVTVQEHAGSTRQAGATSAESRSFLEVLDQATPSDHAARQRLFALWRLDEREVAGPSVCATAVLACFEGRGTWQTLKTLNRPALIWLGTPEGERVEALVTALGASAAELTFGGAVVVADLAEITPHWTGRYLVLSRPPAGVTRNLHVGMWGDDIAWLRDHMRRLRGERPGGLDEPVFDDGLRAQVMDFQRSRGLVEDGIVGPKTLVHLVNAAPEDTEPVLTAEN